MSLSEAVGLAACALAAVPAGLRWLRVAQREHYLPDACSRFALRWWTSEPANVVLGVVGLAGVVGAAFSAWAALATAAVAVVGPRHLSVRGRTAPLAFTRRLKLLAATWVVLQAVVLALGVAAGVAAPVAAAGALGVPLLVDLACLVLAPIERRVGERYVRAATERLGKVAPLVVGITGSYGKTSTKNHVAHLVTGTRTVVASPASFNNRAGLARAVNEHLADGTEVFVAEMGTYGPGEIAELCSWCPPEVAVITAIGPVHLERFGSLERIVAAKAEITEHARVVVLNVDDPRLARLAEVLSGAGSDGQRTVVRCSAVDPHADVCVRVPPAAAGGPGAEVGVAGTTLASGVALAPGVQPTNVACALAVAMAAGVPPAEAVGRVATIPPVPNRLNRARAASGATVLDDTFNANPAGSRAALEALVAAAGPDPDGHHRVVVTPGMIELGPLQAGENRAFARAAAAVATELVVVGQTNRRALLGGAEGVPTMSVRTREEAVAWVRANLGDGDTVLYENDLPDHYP